MTRKWAYFLLFLSILVSCIRNKHPFEYNLQSQADLLMNAYNENSLDKLEKFFENWKKEIPTINPVLIENDTLIEIYELFKSFYQPANLALYGSEWGEDSLYNDVKYFIVQNSINCKIVDSVYHSFNPLAPREYLEEIIINDFRPLISYGSIESVLYSSEYSSIINDFLGEGVYDDDHREEYRESRERLRFINNLVFITHGHWGGWHILTHPRVGLIKINNNFTKANIDYKVLYEWGWAYLEKQEGEWVVVKACMTMIE